MRRLLLFGKKLQQQFGREPDFTLADVERALSAEDSSTVLNPG